jgi:hypothetical protein
MSFAKRGIVGCSRLAAVGTIAAACLALSGVAQAAAPPDPHTLGTSTLSHIELNGVLGTELTVAPGADVKIKANWEDPRTGCLGCLDHTSVAFAGNPAAGCIGSASSEHFEEFSGSAEVDLGPAPNAPGTYNVGGLFELSFTCGEQWNASASSGYPVIARVTVSLPVPTNKEQCKKGGWQQLAAPNGKPFASQGECVSFVASRGRSLEG